MVASVQRNNHSQLAGEAVNLGPRAERRPGPYPMNAADARFIGKHDAQLVDTPATEYRLYCPFLNALISHVCMPPRGERERKTQTRDKALSVRHQERKLLYRTSIWVAM
jgi:hypothetical protein